MANDSSPNGAFFSSQVFQAVGGETSVTPTAGATLGPEPRLPAPAEADGPWLREAASDGPRARGLRGRRGHERGGRPPGRPGPARPPSRQSRPAPRSPETASLTRSSRKCQIEIIRPQGQGPPGPPHRPALGLRVSRALGGAASEERRLSPVGSDGLRAIAFGNVPARPSARTRSPLPAGAPPAPTPLPPPPDLSPIFSILCPGTCGTVISGSEGDALLAARGRPWSSPPLPHLGCSRCGPRRGPRTEGIQLLWRQRWTRKTRSCHRPESLCLSLGPGEAGRARYSCLFS